MERAIAAERCGKHFIADGHAAVFDRKSALTGRRLSARAAILVTFLERPYCAGYLRNLSTLTSRPKT
jgi:hypothetical protein